jgi:radical SAM protein with 4Fe4S-binding SPASM domain
MKLNTAVIEITNRCNLRCIHCGSDSGAPRDDELTPRELIDLIDQVAELGCVQVGLLGGELFLRRDWADAAQRVRAAGMELVLVTNGLLVDDGILGTLVELAPARVGISIDGATRETYRAIRGADAFERTLEAIDRVAGAGLPAVNAITTFHRMNLPEFELFIPLLKGRGVSWQVQIAGKAGRFSDDLFFTADDYRRFCTAVLDALTGQRDIGISVMDDFGYFPLEPRPKFLHAWAGCHAGIGVLGLRSNGDVLPCLSLGDAFVVSNIRREPLRRIWENDAYFDAFRNKEKYLRGHCAACAVRRRCRGGCSAIAWSATGTLFENPYCIRAMESEKLLDIVCSPDRGT